MSYIYHLVPLILMIFYHYCILVAGMIITGKIAITARQKIAKGFSDIENKISISELEEKSKDQEKLRQTYL